MARKQYHVVPAGAQWHVTHQGSVLASFATKQPAIDEGVRVARQNTPSQLLIHRADGTIEDERTYGDDPYPPRG